ncbi:hypothetical protein [Flavisolibacter nicotianae]|uniref:hypothetical protein n=1 Tax=Flavisolibacter nicotianae TaxID=2364882 RepID=UPI001F096699|nr:hypothetical protein [Flavisolibacter nicotianae]
MPLSGAVSVAHPKAVLIQNSIDVSWQAYGAKGTAKIWLATANNMTAGETDTYQLVGEVPVAKQHLLIDVKDKPSGFYKIIVEGPYNAINRWAINEEKN